jgi:ectoine hydroxylase-related dioxygenase (phytanoyl-CoA dioxygenase family)
VGSTDLEIEGDFWRDGAVCVRGAFGPGDVDLARQAIDADLADLSPHARRASADDDGAFVEDFCSWQRIAELESFVRTSPAAAIAGTLLGCDEIRLYHDHVLVKEPGTRQRTPWHQDLPYYNVDGRQNVSMWILGWELEPGDAVFFHMLTLHSAGGVEGPHRRRVLSVRFLGDDMVHAPRPWTTSPPFPGLEDELAAGAPLDHPLFPVLWRR